MMKQNENEMNFSVPLEIIKASEIEPKEVKWLWYPYIPFGKVTLLQGDPGDGKSKLMLSIAALLSKGEPLPFTETEENEPKFSIGVSENGALVGVAICGRPVARRLDDGYTLEVNRLCTDGTPNACSILYAAAYRAARAMGYNKVITYILDTENGASLKAAGYTCEGRAGGLEWNGAKAPKQADQYPRQMKTRWVKKKEGLHGS